MTFNVFTQIVSRIPCKHFVLCKVAKHFIHADILVLVSELVVVVVLSEWWSVPTTVGTSLTIKLLLRVNHCFWLKKVTDALATIL